jgi:hypothetical protein
LQGINYPSGHKSAAKVQRNYELHTKKTDFFYFFLFSKSKPKSKQEQTQEQTRAKAKSKPG